MRKLLISTAIVGLIGAAAYAPAASANSVFLELTSGTPSALAIGATATWDVVMTLDGQGGGDGNLKITTVTVVMSNAAALITHGVSAPESSGVGLTNFSLRDDAFYFIAVGSCINTATTGTCTYAPGAEAAGNYGGITLGVANIGTFTVGTVTVTGFGPGDTTLQLIIRPGTQWVDGTFSNVIPPTLGSALVNVVPEPATASLIGLGVVGLVLVSRRSCS